MRFVLALAAGCATPPPPRLEHHAEATGNETFVLDAPLFSSDATDSVVWTLDHHGTAATLALGDEDLAHGTFEEHGNEIHVEVASSIGPTTLDCHRTFARVHIKGAEPEPRSEHPVCSVPRAWQPADLASIAVLACTVHREQLVTQVTMSPPPGLQAIVDDCCDDEDRCERRWEVRLR